MQSISVFYDMLKSVSDFEIVIGGTMLPTNFEKGTILITPLYSNPITRSDKYFTHIIERNDKKYISSHSLVKETFQIDVYKINPINTHTILAFETAKMLQEYLKSYDVSEFLKDFNIEILPNFETIAYTNEFTEQKKLVNRAFFEFSVVSQETILQEVNTFSKITQDNLILNSKGGHNERWNTIK